MSVHNTEERSHELTFALKHKHLKDFVTKSGKIITKEFLNTTHYQNQKTKLFLLQLQMVTSKIRQNIGKYGYYCGVS